jgi:hypothetical protein
MKQLSTALLGVTLAGLASAVGAVAGSLAATMLQFAYGRFNPDYFWWYDDPTEMWHYNVPPEMGAVIGAIAGILLGVWLTRRILEARRGR